MIPQQVDKMQRVLNSLPACEKVAASFKWESNSGPLIIDAKTATLSTKLLHLSEVS